MARQPTDDVAVTDDAAPAPIGHNRPPSQIEPPRYLTYPELRQYGVNYSRKHLIDLQRAGLFPQARQLSANRVGWVQSEIIAYLESRPVSRAALAREQEAVSVDSDYWIGPGRLG
jgi:predicted DNA-binding transcriptional regulator AlpA